MKLWPFNKKPKKKEISASTTKGSAKKWKPMHETVAEELLSGNYKLIRARSKQASINFPNIKKAVLEYKESIVGNGIRVIFNHDNQRTEIEIRNMWRRFTQTNNFSSDGELSFESMQRLIIDEVSTVGEVFLKKNIQSDLPTNTVPYNYQIITPEMVADDLINADEEDDTVVNGIGYNAMGKKTAYYFYELDYKQKDPLNSALLRNKKVRIPADQIHHVYNRIDNSFRRGLPLITTAIIHGWLGKNLDESQMKKQVIAAMFAGFIQDLSAEISENANMASEPTYDNEIKPGSIVKLDSGKTITFPDTPKADSYAEFNRANLQKIASATGLSYESISNDYSQTNYSSARQSHIKQSRIMDMYRKDIMIERFIRPVLNDFLDYIRLMDLFSLRGLDIQIVTPKPIVIDPQKEIAPKVEEIRSGLQSWSEAINERGQDPEQLARQISRDNSLFDELGLKLDIDSRYSDKQGQLKNEEESQLPPE